MIIPKIDNSSIKTIEQNPDDEFSVRGCFSWEAIGDLLVPCILKNDGDKYVSLEIVDKKLLSKFPHKLNDEMRDIINIKRRHITGAEIKLLNEINNYHCQKTLCKGFTNSDLLVRLYDVKEFYKFLTWYNELFAIPSGSKNNKCGFLWIGTEVVSFLILNNKKYVPLFFFIGEEEYLSTLQTKAICVKGWNLVYIKFCCIVHGINKEFYAKEDCLVVSLDVLQEYFLGQTSFVEFWPTKEVEKHINQINNTQNLLVSQSPVSQSSPVLTSFQNIVNHTESYFPKVSPQPIRPKTNVATTLASNTQTYQINNNSTTAMHPKAVTYTVPSNAYPSNQTPSAYPTPPFYVPTQNVKPHNTTPGINTNFTHYLNNSNGTQPSTTVRRYPPPTYNASTNAYCNSPPASTFQHPMNGVVPSIPTQQYPNVNETSTNNGQNIPSNQTFPRTYGSANRNINRTNNVSLAENETLLHKKNYQSNTATTNEEIIDLTESSPSYSVPNFATNSIMSDLYVVCKQSCAPKSAAERKKESRQRQKLFHSLVPGPRFHMVVCPGPDCPPSTSSGKCSLHCNDAPNSTCSATFIPTPVKYNKWKTYRKRKKGELVPKPAPKSAAERQRKSRQRRKLFHSLVSGPRFHMVVCPGPDCPPSTSSVKCSLHCNDAPNSTCNTTFIPTPVKYNKWKIYRRRKKGELIPKPAPKSAAERMKKCRRRKKLEKLGELPPKSDSNFGLLTI